MIQYTMSTGLVGTADAAEIFADMATADPVTDQDRRKRKSGDQENGHRLLLFGFIVRMLRSKLLDHGAMSDIQPDVADEGDQQKHTVDGSDNIHRSCIHFRNKDHKGQADEQHCGADFACHKGTGEDLSFAYEQVSCHQLENLLHKEERCQDPEKRVLEGQADDQGKLSEFVSQGVKDPAGVGDHIKASGDLTVDQIRQAGNCQDSSSDVVILRPAGVEIYCHINRDQYQTEQTKQVRYGKQILFPFI